MTDKNYSGISDAELAPGQPITTSLMTRMRDDALAVTQNDPIAMSFGGLAGNWVSRWQLITTPIAPAIGTFTVPTGVRRLMVILCGAGGCGSGSQAGIIGNGGITYFGGGSAPYPRVEGGFGNNASNRHAEYFDCLIGQRGEMAGWRDGRGCSTIFGPGGAVGDPGSSYGSGGGHSTMGGGGSAVGMTIVNVSPGDEIPYQIGISTAGGVLAGGGEEGGPGCILVGY
jgi:hypothetical protein